MYRYVNIICFRFGTESNKVERAKCTSGHVFNIVALFLHLGKSLGTYDVSEEHHIPYYKEANSGPIFIGIDDSWFILEDCSCPAIEDNFYAHLFY